MTESIPAPFHAPVMLEECLQALNLDRASVKPLSFVDATAGLGGHLLSIASRAPRHSTIIGIDRDQAALNFIEKRIEKECLTNDRLRESQIRLIHSEYSLLPEALSEIGLDTIDGGILADLGVSSMQLDEAERGFSFSKDGPLDMRMDKSQGQSASELLQNLSETELADILYIYGEERLSRPLAKKIISALPIKSTAVLSDIVSEVVYAIQGRRRGEDKHPATRTFQALRIAVNDELGHLKKFLRAALASLSPGARLAIISFHSLEDRIVKQFFKEAASACICPPRFPICTCSKKKELELINKKALVPTASETLANPRSRSAKLRVGERV